MFPPGIGIGRNPVAVYALVCLLAVSRGLSPLHASGGDAGPDQHPSAGQSLFDELFGVSQAGEPTHDIPFPLTALISRLESFQGNAADGSPNLLPVAMIPLGRCVGRYAASPDFFSSPRLVLATTLEDAGRSGTERPFVKDRLFIGYQPKTRTMEVISYNETAGRFEFQQVAGYGDDVAEVTYPERNTCTACHQNRGPIFSRAPWDETDFNLDIYQAVAEAHGFAGKGRMQDRNTDAMRIDSSTNRANKFGLFQEFWQNICVAKAEHDAIRCRAALLEILVRYRLQGQGGALPWSQRSAGFLIPGLVRGARTAWPDGISIPSSDVPNANPLAGKPGAHLSSAGDLRLPREPTIRWKPDEIDLMVDGLAGMIPLSDMQALDNRLYRLALLRQESATYIEGQCRVIPSDPGNASPLFDQPATVFGLRCSMQDGRISDTYRLFGTLESESGRIKMKTPYRHMAMDSESAMLNFTHDGGVIASHPGSWHLALALYDPVSGFHVRLPGRGIMDSLELWWPRSGSSLNPWDSDQPIVARSRMRVIPEYYLIDAALDRLVSLSEQGGADILTDEPFRGRQAVRALAKQLY